MHINTRQIPKSSYKYFIELVRDLITLSLQQRQNKKMKFEYPKWPGERARNNLHSVIRYSSARSVSAQRGALGEDIPSI